MYMKELVAEDLLGQVFFSNSVSYKIIEITKTWGETPVILGYIKAKDHYGEIKELKIDCRINFPKHDWIIDILQKEK